MSKDVKKVRGLAAEMHEGGKFAAEGITGAKIPVQSRPGVWQGQLSKSERRRRPAQTP